MTERSDYTERLNSLLERYLRDVELAEINHKPGEGIFGTKGGVKDDPCHDRLVRDLTAFFEEVQAAAPPSEELQELLSALYTAARGQDVPRGAYWMLVAVHGLSRPLVELLSVEDAAALARRYTADYPRRERFPAQQELVQALLKRGSVKEPRRRLF